MPEITMYTTSWCGYCVRAKMLLDSLGLPYEEINLDDDPHFRQRSLVEITGNEALGRVLTPGPVLHVRDYDGPAYDGVPTIGQHTSQVLGELLDLGPADLDRLSAAGITRAG